VDYRGLLSRSFSELEKTFQDWNVAISVDVIPEIAQKGATRALRINTENGE
jgi:hypothetical protein